MDTIILKTCTVVAEHHIQQQAFPFPPERVQRRTVIVISCMQWLLKKKQNRVGLLSLGKRQLWKDVIEVFKPCVQ